MRRLINGLAVVIIIVFSSCQDLAPFLFNPEKIDSYQYDDYDAGEFTLDSTYAILQGELNPFTVQSDLDGDIATIHGVYLGDLNTIDQDTVILYCHGNTSNMDGYFQRTKLLYNLDKKSKFGVVTFDYRGYGLSEGTSSEEGLEADLKAIMQWLIDRGMNSERLYIYGFSLGSIPAIAACADQFPLTPSKLMLEAPIGSIDAMAKGGTGLEVPGSFFADLETNNIELIKSVNQPMYIVHGDSDDFLDISTHGLPIYDQYIGKYRKFNVIEGAGHSDIPWVEGVEIYNDSLSVFVNRTF